MKRVLTVALALMISVAFVSTVFAQAKPAEKPAAPAEKPAAPADKPAAPADKPAAPAEKPAAPADKPAEKPKPKLPAGFIGKVESIDNTAQVMVVKNKKEAVVFDTSKPKLKGYKSIEQIKVGDTVAAKYEKKEGLSITKIAGAKAEKKAPAAKPEKAEKKAEKKEAPPAK